VTDFDAYEYRWAATDRRGHAFAVLTDHGGRPHFIERGDHWVTLCGHGPWATATPFPLTAADVPPCKLCLALFDELIFTRPTIRMVDR